MYKEATKLKYITLITIAYVAVIITSISLATKLMPIHIFHISLYITGGTLVIPLAFFIQDITTEVYGYSKSRRIVQISIFALIAYLIIVQIAKHYFIADFVKGSFFYVFFDTLYRHIIAFIIAVFFGTFVNDLLISKLKLLFKGKYLPLRFILATMCGEAVYMLLALFVWWKYLSFYSILPLITFSYCYRIIFEAAATPLNYGVSRLLKKSEGVDVYDKNISYNPFIWKDS